MGGTEYWKHMPDVLIIYAISDEELARIVHDILQIESVSTFLASTSLLPGQNLSDEIRKALSESEWVVFLASEAACRSQWVQKELGMAFRTGKTVVPIVWNMDLENLPGWTRELQALDLRDLSPDAASVAITELATKIRKNKEKGNLIAIAALAGLMFVLFK